MESTQITPLDISQPLRRRDNGEFEIWKKDDKKIWGRFKDNYGGWIACAWNECGRFNPIPSHGCDLLPAPRRIEGWVAVAKGCCSQLHETKQEALDWFRLSKLHDYQNPEVCIYIDVEEGEGL